MQVLGGQLYVAFALQAAGKWDDGAPSTGQETHGEPARAEALLTGQRSRPWDVLQQSDQSHALLHMHVAVLNLAVLVGTIAREAGLCQ